MNAPGKGETATPAPDRGSDPSPHQQSGVTPDIAGHREDGGQDGRGHEDGGGAEGDSGHDGDSGHGGGGHSGHGGGHDGHSTADPRVWVHRLSGWRESIRARPATYRVYRVAVGVLGGAIVIGGLALVPLPGPGWLIVFVGLRVLATEIEWAARVERFARDQVKAWTRWLGRQSIAVRVLVALLTCAFVAAVVYGVGVVFGVPGWIPDGLVPPLPGLE